MTDQDMNHQREATKPMPMPWPRRLAWLVTVASLTLLAGCAQQRIRDEAQAQFRQGQYEAALQTLREGVDQYPDSALLKTGLAAIENDALGQLLAQAMALRLAGQADQAEALLTRAATMAPQHPRVRELQAELARDRQAQAAWVQARQQAEAGDAAAALLTLDAALMRAPRHPELTALRRQLEAERHARSAPARLHRLAETRPIALSFRNAPLSSILEALRDGTGVNFVVDRDVQMDQTASVYIREASADDAIDLVLGAFQLARRVVDARTVLVYPSTPDKHKQHREQVIRVFHLAHGQAKATAELLQSLLRIEAPFVDEKANMIALREPPEIVALAERLVALHDMAEPEVMLEVEVLEVKTSRLTELGINFPSSFSLSLLPLPGQTGITVDTFNSLNLRGGAQGINYGQLGLSVGSLLVNFKREVGDFNTLANPRIRTRNREKATILVGDKVPVITTTAASSGGFVSESVNYLDVGLKLEVEPVVSPDDEVAIRVGLEVSSLAREVRSATGSVAYQIGTRNANTTLRLRDGETQLLGGLISKEDRTNSNRVPGLGDLPLAGRLFSSQKDDLQNTELILAITPRILRGAPRPDLAQAEMWVGTENFTRMRASPVAMAQAPTATSPRASGQATASAAAGTAAGAAAVQPEGLQLQLRGPATLKVGEEAQVQLVAASGLPMTGFPVTLNFASEVLEVLDVSEGDYFKQTGAVSSFMQRVDKARQRANVMLTTTSDRGVRGEGVVATFRVRALASGQAKLEVIDQPLRGQSGAVRPPSWPSLSIEVR